jgi:hypothetical protein
MGDIPRALTGLAGRTGEEKGGTEKASDTKESKGRDESMVKESNERKQTVPS